MESVLIFRKKGDNSCMTGFCQTGSKSFRNTEAKVKNSLNSIEWYLAKWYDNIVTFIKKF